MREEREREMNSVPKNDTVQNLFYLWVPKNGLQQMPSLYNTYRAMVLRRKFYKDK
jgi:hypothetical protein